ncbi:MAG: hypothetical protein OEM66_01350 [Acidimicrobiia bacterium]|nr:hypothetical protein [Acidimicrobiia bacterium]
MNSEADIVRELAHLERRLRAASEQLINPGQVGMAGGPGGGGFEPKDVARLNAAIRKAQGIDRMEARIEELRRQLADLAG